MQPRESWGGVLTTCHDVGVKRSFDPSDTGLLRTLCSCNPGVLSYSQENTAEQGGTIV